MICDCGRSLDQNHADARTHTRRRDKRLLGPRVKILFFSSSRRERGGVCVGEGEKIPSFPPSADMNFGLISIYANEFLIAGVMTLAWEIFQSAMFFVAACSLHL